MSCLIVFVILERKTPSIWIGCQVVVGGFIRFIKPDELRYTCREAVIGNDFLFVYGDKKHFDFITVGIRGTNNVSF